jgi:DNA-directed RNA polymerase specialized sigma24 family protein
MDRILRRCFAKTKTTSQLAKILGVTVCAIHTRAHRLGLRAYWRWVIREDEYLTKYYQHKTAEEIGQALDRKADAVRARVRALGLRKNRKPAKRAGKRAR